jgi:hypothetical protein
MMNFLAANPNGLMKLQAPMSKLQRNSKPEAPNAMAAVVEPLVLNNWCFSGAWTLELGAF